MISNLDNFKKNHENKIKLNVTNDAGANAYAAKLAASPTPTALGTIEILEKLNQF